MTSRPPQESNHAVVRQVTHGLDREDGVERAIRRRGGDVAKVRRVSRVSDDERCVAAPDV